MKASRREWEAFFSHGRGRMRMHICFAILIGIGLEVDLGAYICM